MLPARAFLALACARLSFTPYKEFCKHRIEYLALCFFYMFFYDRLYFLVYDVVLLYCLRILNLNFSANQYNSVIS